MQRPNKYEKKKVVPHLIIEVQIKTSVLILGPIKLVKIKKKSLIFVVSEGVRQKAFPYIAGCSRYSYYYHFSRNGHDLFLGSL